MKKPDLETQNTWTFFYHIEIITIIYNKNMNMKKEEEVGNLCYILMGLFTVGYLD